MDKNTSRTTEAFFLSTHSLYPMWQLLNNSRVFVVSGTDWAFSHESLNYKFIPLINNKQVNLNWLWTHTELLIWDFSYIRRHDHGRLNNNDKQQLCDCIPGVWWTHHIHYIYFHDRTKGSVILTNKLNHQGGVDKAGILSDNKSHKENKWIWLSFFCLVKARFLNFISLFHETSMLLKKKKQRASLFAG